MFSTGSTKRDSVESFSKESHPARRSESLEAAAATHHVLLHRRWITVFISCCFAAPLCTDDQEKANCVIYDGSTCLYLAGVQQMIICTAVSQVQKHTFCFGFFLDPDNLRGKKKTPAHYGCGSRWSGCLLEAGASRNWQSEMDATDQVMWKVPYVYP